MAGFENRSSAIWCVKTVSLINQMVEKNTKIAKRIGKYLSVLPVVVEGFASKASNSLAVTRDFLGN
jgi:hypothetical protein